MVGLGSFPAHLPPFPCLSPKRCAQRRRSGGLRELPRGAGSGVSGPVRGRGGAAAGLRSPAGFLSRGHACGSPLPPFMRELPPTPKVEMTWVYADVSGGIIIFNVLEFNFVFTISSSECILESFFLFL